MPVLCMRPEGLYCPAGDFYIDPWQGVDRAVITHAHSDHARWGSRQYLCSTPCKPVLGARLGHGHQIDAWDYGVKGTLGGATVSLHPAGHIWGSAQIRVEVGGEVWVVSGDYKTQPDKTAPSWEPVKCHGFVTETTFGLPIYRWRSQEEVFSDINQWWSENSKAGRASVLFGYALGKAQRLIAGVDPSIGPIVVHGAVAAMNRACEVAGLGLPAWQTVSDGGRSKDWAGALVVAPPSAAGTPWMRRFGDASTGYASGWMAIRGLRRRRNVDRGFVLSDHVDWPSLMTAIKETGAGEVWTTHGYAHQVARFLDEQGLVAKPLETQFVGEEVADA